MRARVNGGCPPTPPRQGRPFPLDLSSPFDWAVQQVGSGLLPVRRVLRHPSRCSGHWWPGHFPRSHPCCTTLSLLPGEGCDGLGPTLMAANSRAGQAAAVAAVVVQSSRTASAAASRMAVHTSRSSHSRRSSRSRRSPPTRCCEHTLSSSTSSKVGWWVDGRVICHPRGQAPSHHWLLPASLVHCCTCVCIGGPLVALAAPCFPAGHIRRAPPPVGLPHLPLPLLPPCPPILAPALAPQAPRGCSSRPWAASSTRAS